MKITFFLLLASLSTQAFSQEHVFLSVKDRVRLSLWSQGLESSTSQKNLPSKAPRRIEELERVLKKI